MSTRLKQYPLEGPPGRHGWLPYDATPSRRPRPSVTSAGRASSVLPKASSEREPSSLAGSLHECMVAPAAGASSQQF